MILRKPYAFLIKHFKMFHLILTLITAYLLKSTLGVLNFFNEYLANTEVTYYEDHTSQLFSKWMFILPIVMLLIVAVVLMVLVKKKKPTMFYFIVVGMSIGSCVLFSMSMNLVIDMETEIIETQRLSLMKDFLLFAVALQGYTLAINFVRAIGFDVKKFDFGKDLHDIVTEEEDNEEVEVSIAFDTNLINRRYRRTKRFFKYRYIENQLIFNIAFATTGFIIVAITAYIMIKKDQLIPMNQIITTKEYTISLTNAYKTALDYRGNKIKDGKEYIIVEMELSSNIEERILDSRNFQLVLDDKTYYHNNKYKEQLFDLGNVYVNERVSFNPNIFLFVYEIEDYTKDSKIFFRVSEEYDSASDRLKEEFQDIALIIEDLDKVEVINKDAHSEIVVNTTIFKDSKLVIDAYEIADKFKINYRRKISKNEYYDSIEYIVPKVDENYDEGMMYVSGTLELANKNAGISKFTTFLIKFGSITYESNGVAKKFYFKSYSDSDKVTLKDQYYMEIKKEILNSKETYLDFRFRNKLYRYKLEQVDL